MSLIARCEESESGEPRQIRVGEFKFVSGNSLSRIRIRAGLAVRGRAGEVDDPGPEHIEATARDLLTVGAQMLPAIVEMIGLLLPRHAAGVLPHQGEEESDRPAVGRVVALL